jgi:CBS domain-containing protein
MLKVLANRPARTRTIREVMEPVVVTVVPQMTVRELVELFAEQRIRGAPVVGPSGKVVGLVSEGDVLRRAVAGEGVEGWDPDGLRVRDVMGPVGETWGPDEELPGLLRAFSREGTQRALVIENEILLGIVTAADVLRGIGQVG